MIFVSPFLLCLTVLSAMPDYLLSKHADINAGQNTRTTDSRDGKTGGYGPQFYKLIQDILANKSTNSTKNEGVSRRLPASVAKVENGSDLRMPGRVSSDWFHGIRMSKESKKIVSVLRKVINTELGVTTLQALYDSTPFVASTPDEAKILAGLVDKVEKKILSLRVFLEDVLDNATKPGSANTSADNFTGTTKNISFCLASQELSPLATARSLCPTWNELLARSVSPIANEFVHWLSHATTSIISQRQFAAILEWPYDRMEPSSFMSVEYPAPGNQAESIIRRWSDLDQVPFDDIQKRILILIDFTEAEKSEIAGLKRVVLSVIDFVELHYKYVVVVKTAAGCRGAGSPSCSLSSSFVEKERTRTFFSSGALGFDPAWENVRTGNEVSCFKILRRFSSTGHLDLIYLTTRQSFNRRPVSLFAKNSRMRFDNIYVAIMDNSSEGCQNSKLHNDTESTLRSYQCAYRVSTVLVNGSVPFSLLSSLVQWNWVADDRFLAKTHLDLPERYVNGTPTVTLTMLRSIHYPSDHYPSDISAKRYVAVGMDILLDQVLEYVMHHPPDSLPSKAYLFGLDREERVLFHPLLHKSAGQSRLISDFENGDGFKEILSVMMQVPRGNLTDPAGRMYAWQHVAGLSLISCITWIPATNRLQTVVSNGASWWNDTSLPTLLYHRFDQLSLPDERLCAHSGRRASTLTCGVYLPPSSFSSPLEHLLNDESRQVIEGYLAFFNDRTNLLANGRLKARDAKTQVEILRKICGDWMVRFHVSKLNSSISRRFVSTRGGTMVSLPTVRLNLDYDPTREEWHKGAELNPGKIFVTPPVVGNPGSPLVTLSHSIYDGKRTAMHSTSDTVAAVIGLDLTAEYLCSLLEELVPSCQQPGLRCFLMDDRGYVVAHRKLSSLFHDRGPLELYHVTHVEPAVASEMIADRGLLDKRTCLSPSRHATERYFYVNLENEDVHISERSCSTFGSILLPGTNMIFVVVNANCTKSERTFCPCNHVDRLCLNCQRNGKTECECPCECPVACDFQRDDQQELCWKRGYHTGAREWSGVAGMGLRDCAQMACVARGSQGPCEAADYCEWCDQKNEGGRNWGGFCTLRGKCLEGLTDEEWEVETVSREKSLNIIKSSPVLPLTCGLLGCFCCAFIIALCCKYYRRPEPSVPYFVAADPRSARVNYTGISEGNAQDNNPVGYVNPAGEIDAVSPYRINPGYRPPTSYVAGARSTDQGYSTVGGQDDLQSQSAAGTSECAASTVGSVVRNPKVKHIREISESQFDFNDKASLTASEVTETNDLRSGEDMTVLRDERNRWQPPRPCRLSVN